MTLTCKVQLDHHLGYGLHGSFKVDDFENPSDPSAPSDSAQNEKSTGFSVTIKNTGQTISNIKAGTKLRTALL